MRRFALVTACLVLFAGPLSAAEPIQTTAVSVPSGLVRHAGLDAVFMRFGESLALSARRHGVGDARFLDAWEAATRDAFARGGLDRKLTAGLAEALDRQSLETLDGFLHSPLGARVAMLEQSVQGLPQHEQIAIIAKGQALLLVAEPSRRARIADLLALSNADLTFSVLAESLRGMALGLHLARNGDISVPWDEIDAAVDAQLAGLEANLTDASLAVMAYTFAALSEAELDAYLQHLRAPETQTFQALAAYVVASAIHDTMSTLADEVARRLKAVAI